MRNVYSPLRCGGVGGLLASSPIVPRAVTLSAKVTSTQGNAEGPVDFYDITTGVDLTPDPVALVNGTAELTLATLPGGQQTIVATYLGDANFEVSSSQTRVTVLTGATTTTVTEPASAEFGQEAKLSVSVAAVSAGAQSPTGSVDFMDTTTGTDLGSFPLVNVAGANAPPVLMATLQTINTLPVGTHAITATYSGDGNYTSGSDTFDLTVINAVTTTVVQPLPNPAAPGATVDLQAMVTLDPASTATLEGMVQFAIDGEPEGDPVPLSGGLASLPSVTAPSGVGNHTVTASFIGGGGFAPSSGTLGLTVSASSTIEVTESQENGAVTFNATVSTTGPNAPTGTVLFTIDGSNSPPVSVDNSGHASLTLTALPRGGLAFVATYSGDANTSGSTTATVLKPSELTLKISPSTWVFGEKITVTAHVKATGGAVGTPTGAVIFTVDGVAQAPVTLHAGHAMLIIPEGLGVGAHTVTAQYTGDTAFGGSSDDVSQQVAQGGSTTTLRSSAQAVTATVVAKAPAVGTPTGAVIFYVDGQQFQTVLLNSADQEAVLMVNTLAAGAHTITAEYQGDGNFMASNARRRSARRCIRSGRRLPR